MYQYLIDGKFSTFVQVNKGILQLRSYLQGNYYCIKMFCPCIFIVNKRQRSPFHQVEWNLLGSVNDKFYSY